MGKGSGRTLNPVEQQRKKERKAEQKKNKKRVLQTKTEILSRNPERLKRELHRLRALEDGGRATLADKNKRKALARVNRKALSAQYETNQLDSSVTVRGLSKILGQDSQNSTKKETSKELSLVDVDEETQKGEQHEDVVDDDDDADMAPPPPGIMSPVRPVIPESTKVLGTLSKSALRQQQRKKRNLATPPGLYKRTAPPVSMAQVAPYQTQMSRMTTTNINPVYDEQGDITPVDASQHHSDTTSSNANNTEERTTDALDADFGATTSALVFTPSVLKRKRPPQHVSADELRARAALKKRAIAHGQRQSGTSTSQQSDVDNFMRELRTSGTL